MKEATRKEEARELKTMIKAERFLSLKEIFPRIGSKNEPKTGIKITKKSAIVFSIIIKQKQKMPSGKALQPEDTPCLMKVEYLFYHPWPYCQLISLQLSTQNRNAVLLPK
jgi:hypothetical protein